METFESDAGVNVYDLCAGWAQGGLRVPLNSLRDGTAGG